MQRKNKNWIKLHLTAVISDTVYSPTHKSWSVDRANLSLHTAHRTLLLEST